MVETDELMADLNVLVSEKQRNVSVTAPSEESEHPRMILVKTGKEVGVSVETVRNRVLAAPYLTDFASWCTLVDAHIYNTQALCDAQFAAKNYAELARQCYCCSFLALLNPELLKHPSTGNNLCGHTREEYAGYARLAALTLSKFFYNPTTGITYADEGNGYQDWGHFTDGGLKSLPIALAYDWTMAAVPSVWSDADRQVLAEMAVRAAYGARTQLTPQSDFGPFSAIDANSALNSRTGSYGFVGSIIGEALLPEVTSLTGSCPVGFTDLTYQNEIANLSLRFRASGSTIVKQTDYFLGQTGLWHEGPLYNIQAISATWGFLDAYGTVVQENIYGPTSFRGDHADGILTWTQPQRFNNTYNTNSHLQWTYSASGIGDNEITPREMEFASIAQPELAKWAMDNVILNDYSTITRYQSRLGWWWYTRWIHGYEHYTAISPYQHDSTASKYVGKNMLMLRTKSPNTYAEFSDVTQTQIPLIFFRYILGGHQQPTSGGFGIFKGGILLPSKGKTNKSSIGVSAALSPELGLSTVRVYSAAEAADNSITFLDAPSSSRSSETAPSPTNQFPTTTAIAYGASQVRALSLNNAAFDYVQLETTCNYSTLDASFAQREWGWLKSVLGGKEYLVLLDRITLASGTHRVLQNFQLGITDNQDLVSGRTAPLALSGTQTRVAHTPTVVTSTKGVSSLTRTVGTYVVGTISSLNSNDTNYYVITHAEGSTPGLDVYVTWSSTPKHATGTYVWLVTGYQTATGSITVQEWNGTVWNDIGSIPPGTSDATYSFPTAFTYTTSPRLRFLYNGLAENGAGIYLNSVRLQGSVSVSGGADDWSHGEWTSNTSRTWRWRNNYASSTGGIAMTVVEPISGDLENIHVLGGSYCWHHRDADPVRRRFGVIASEVVWGSSGNPEFYWTVADEAALQYGRWRMEVRPYVGITQPRFLTVFQLDSNSNNITTANDVTRLLSSDNSFVGVRIDDPARKRIILYRVGTLNSSFSYDAGTIDTCHTIITGLTAGTTYSVSKVGSTITVTLSGSYTVDSGGCLEVTL